MGIKLSVLVPSVHTRRTSFIPKSLEMLYGQYDNLPPNLQDKIEILFLIDNKKMMLGGKRNSLVDLAQGEYVVFVDDDDRIEPNYLSELLQAVETDADVVTFKVSVTINGGKPKIATYSKGYEKDYNTKTGYYRLPNHICCVKREHAVKVAFPNIIYGEDKIYGQLLKEHLKTEHAINKVLYHYDYSDMVTETQTHIPAVKVKRRAVDAIADIVMLSNAKTEAFQRMTQRAIDTCILGANGLPVNVIVIEQQAEVRYEDAKTVYHPAEFNYNAFMNLGAREGQAKWVMFANNDLVFTDGWLHNLLAANHDLVSPKCPKDPRQKAVKENEVGVVNGRNLSGWCFMMKRTLWDKIGGLDEDFIGWYADDATIEQCVNVGVNPMLVPDSIVEHLGSTTLKTLPEEERDNLCWSKLELFNKKYNKNKFHDNPNYLSWKKRQRIA